MRFHAIHAKRPPESGYSPGALCLLALAVVVIKPLAQEVSDYLRSDRDEKVDEVLHAFHLPPAAGMEEGQRIQYITKLDPTQTKPPAFDLENAGGFWFTLRGI